MSDWENHLTTIFPDVRLKRYLEMRGADGGPWRLICALPALWVGLLYDAQVRGGAAGSGQRAAGGKRGHLAEAAAAGGCCLPAAAL